MGARVMIPPQCRQEVLHELHLAHPGVTNAVMSSHGQRAGRNDSEV